MPPDILGPGEAEPARRAQDGVPGEPGPGASGPLPSGPQAEGEPGDAQAAAKGSQGTRAFLGLGPGEVPPSGRPGAVKAGKGGKPAKAKTKRAPKGPASQRARGSPSTQVPSGNPASRIQHWLLRTSVTPAEAPARAHGVPAGLKGGVLSKCRRSHGTPQGSLGARQIPLRAPDALVPAGPPFSSRRVRVLAFAGQAEPGGPLWGAAVGAGTAEALGGDHPFRWWAEASWPGAWHT